ncbi:MAG: hypothetical protein MJK08_01020 [Campylobacterales bacterium]|nr:hypothetical protein [Campylobacterales bacterium]
MFKDESQFVNIIKYESQLNINYKKLSNNKIISANQTNFTLHDNILSKDIITKVENLKNDVLKTYTSSLILSSNEKIIRSQNIYDKEEYFESKLNNEYKILIKKNELFEVEHYFKKVGFDYIFSPFHILNMHNEENPTLNSLSILVIDYFVYILIINENNKIVFKKVSKITAFEEIKNSEFYTNDIDAQKLYDEIYYLELTNLIKDVIQQYYSLKNVSFIDKITILYKHKQLSSSQIESFKNDILLDVNYHNISIDESLYELSRLKDSEFKSYVKPAEKKVSYFKFFVTSILVFIIAALSYIYYDRNQNTKINENSIEKSNLIVNNILLPNHIIKNNIIKNNLIKHFNMIPYNIVLKKLTLHPSSSELLCDILNTSTYIKVLRPRLLEEYKISNIEYFNIDDIIKEALIENKDKKYSVYNEKVDLPNYNTDIYMPIKMVTKELKSIFPSTSKIEFISTDTLTTSIFNYNITMNISSPNEIYEIINKLNKELYSINLKLPLTIEIDEKKKIYLNFSLQFNQNI